MGESPSKVLMGIAQHVEIVEAENAALRRVLAVAYPALESLYAALREWHVAPSGVTGACMPAVEPGKAAMVAQAVATATAKKGYGVHYTDAQVAEWYGDMKEGATIKGVARRYKVDPKTVTRRLEMLGYLCACGVLIGTEDPPAEMGHDGVCGYCRGEKQGEAV